MKDKKESLTSCFLVEMVVDARRSLALSGRTAADKVDSPMVGQSMLVFYKVSKEEEGEGWGVVKGHCGVSQLKHPALAHLAPIFNSSYLKVLPNLTHCYI
jgi:hypothetical protein